jgi:hypothetical protein
MGTAVERGRRGWYEGAIITAAVLLLRLPPMLMRRWYDPDEAAIALQALSMRAGGTLYVDIADRKPPLPPLVYRFVFWLTGDVDVRPVRVVVAVMLAVAAIALVRDVTRTHGRSVGRWAGALFVVGALAFSPIDAGAANYAHFALPFATLSIVCCRRRGVGWAMAGGALLGLAILSRQSWLFAVPAGAFSAARAALAVELVPGAAQGGRWRAAGLHVGAFGVACVAAVVAAGAFVPLSDFTYWTFTSSPGFVFAGTDLSTAVVKGLAALGLFLLWHLALVAAAIWSAHRPGVGANLDLWVWVATGCVAVGAGLRFYGHYWMQLLPPLVLLAGPALASFAPRLRTLSAVTLGLGAATAWALLFVPGAFRNRPSAAPVARYIREHTAADDRVFVWGTFPELSVEADRPVAGRLVHSDFVTGRSGGRDDPAETLPTVLARPVEMMMSDLLARPPEIVVDTSGVSSLGYGNYPLSVLPALDAFVEHNYRIETTIGGFTIWRLDPTV